ncbi:MAG: carboxypeptidase-like regulatory domain-containing protein, partial [Bryobacteraceae bacterium]
MLIVLLLVFAALAQAQVAFGTLFGEVRDASSALAPGVHITARQDATGFLRRTVTGNLGEYRLDDLAPGVYTVTAAKEGFRQAVASRVLLEVTQRARLDFRLAIGPATESLTVTAAISPLQTEEASSGYRLDTREILALPLAERNLISLVTL